MGKNFDSLGNLESQLRKTSVVQERASLVASHMFKEFLDFQQSTINTENTFFNILETIKEVTEYLKQSFSVRNIPTKNINYEIDSTNTIIILNILWHTISITDRYNTIPKALPQMGRTPLFCGRIFAINGNYHDLLRGSNNKNIDEQIKIMLENEIASLYIPAEKNTQAIMTIKHKDNQEILMGKEDASRDFLLKVVEIVCAGGKLHEQLPKKTLWKP